MEAVEPPAKPRHRSLTRQLRRLGLEPGTAPDPDGWAALLDEVSRAYDEADADRYLLERSIEVSSQEMRALHDELSRQARTDGLTGLPNRADLLAALGAQLKAGRAGDRPPALLFVDLDGFKGVNDTCGHRVGDEMLVRAAERIRSCARPDDVVARLGGDEFVVLVTEPADLEAVAAVGARIVDVLTEPFRIGTRDLRIGASVGVTLADSVTSPSDLLQQADIAMYEAKVRGKGLVCVFDEQMRRRTTERLDIEAALRDAVARDELLLHYQPVIRLRDGALIGAEALLRWGRPGHCLAPPDRFIAIAEQTRLITALDAWVINRACQDAAQWPVDASVSVNLSPRDLALDDLADEIAGSLARSRLPARRLVVELTETTLLEARPVVTRNLARLRSLGVRLAIDDFGTGYSSLAYLRRLEADFVKIDRGFLAGTDGDGADRAITTAVVAMCHALGVPVIAEGVERPTQVTALLAMGCDGAQGYHFARPMPHEAFVEYLAGVTPADPATHHPVPRPRALPATASPPVPDRR
jgi:diguanylate cyclase (GGDEF)-like protein